jgi:hypothetical protein
MDLWIRLKSNSIEHRDKRRDNNASPSSVKCYSKAMTLLSGYHRVFENYFATTKRVWWHEEYEYCML